MKNGRRRAFIPLDSIIKSELHVFAEWNANSPQPYRIYYALQQKETDADRLSEIAQQVGKAPQDQHVYSISADGTKASYIYLEQDKGYHLQIAEPSTGYAYEGNLRTFQPKTGNPENQLDAPYASGYFPTVSSHSISIAYEEDKSNPARNVYTFTYVHMDEVEYTVEYRFQADNRLIATNTDPDSYFEGLGDNGSGQCRRTTTMSVVTERFAPLADYLADAFFKKLILAVELDQNGNYVSTRSNVITFYYSNNSNQAYYAIHYLLEDLDGGFTEATNYAEGVATANTTIQIKPPTFDGFTVQQEAELDQIGGTKTTMQEGSFSLPIKENGSELYLYYTRNSQKYAIYYLKEGTELDFENLLPEEQVAEPVQGSGKYGE